MKLDLTYGEHFCYVRGTINGVEIDKEDFGEQYDRDTENAEDYACGDMKFTRIDATPEVLSKYGINEAEYLLVAGQLEAGLSFGNCGLCV